MGERLLPRIDPKVVGVVLAAAVGGSMAFAGISALASQDNPSQSIFYAPTPIPNSPLDVPLPHREGEINLEVLNNLVRENLGVEGSFIALSDNSIGDIFRIDHVNQKGRNLDLEEGQFGYVNKRGDSVTFYPKDIIKDGQRFTSLPWETILITEEGERKIDPVIVYQDEAGNALYWVNKDTEVIEPIPMDIAPEEKQVYP